ncbi:MAG: hypothetical protein ABSE59_10870 [Opitutaceae bacterium]|jgi:hypothetical protein
MADSTPFPASIGTSLNLAKALDLARHGQIDAAQALLTSSGNPPEDPIELHALAALATSTGDFPRALALWRRLQDKDPRHAEARRMIDAIELWENRPPWYRFIPAGAAAVGVAVVAIFVLTALSSPAPVAKSEVTAPPVIAPATYTASPAIAAPPIHFNLNFGAPSPRVKSRHKSVN